MEEVEVGKFILESSTGLDAIKRAPIIIEETGIKCLRIGDISNSKEYKDWGNTKVKTEDYLKAKVELGDILIARTGNTIGCNKYIDFENKKVVFNNGLIRIKVKKEKAFSKYIYYCFQTDKYRKYIESIAYGTSTQPNMKIKDLLAFKVPNFNLETQKRIVSILASLDEKIKLNRKINQNLEEIAQTLFKRWFIDFEFPNEEGKPYKSSGGKMIKSELGEIPEKFYSKKAYEVCDLSIGKTPSRKDTECFKKKKEKGVKWVSISDMNKNEPFLNETNEKITPEAVSKYKVKVINKGSIILSFKLTIGRVKILGENMTTNEAIAHFNIENKILKEYLYLFLKNFNYEKLGNTSSIANAVNSKVIKNIEVILPNENLLFLFHNKVKNIFEKIYIFQKETEKLIELRDYLLPRLMSGEISV